MSFATQMTKPSVRTLGSPPANIINKKTPHGAFYIYGDLCGSNASHFLSASIIKKQNKFFFLTLSLKDRTQRFASLEKIIKHKKRPIGSFSYLVISAGVEPALTGWKPVVLTVILRDQFRNVPFYYNRFRKISNSYVYENASFHGSVLNQANLLIFFRPKAWLKLFFYFLTAQNRIRRIISLPKRRMRLKCHRR